MTNYNTPFYGEKEAKEEKRETVALTIRFPQALHQELKEIADANIRSINSTTLVLLMEALEARKAKGDNNGEVSS